MQVGGVFEAYRIKWSLADWKYGGTAMLLHERCADPINYRFNIDVNGDPKTHHSDGRVICAEFERFFLLNTYTPNKSHKNLKLREAWDTAITSFVKSISSKDKPLVYGGDLNIVRAPNSASCSVSSLVRLFTSGTLFPDSTSRP